MKGDQYDCADEKNDDKNWIFFILYHTQHHVHDYKEVSEVNKHVQCLPNFWRKIVQPKIMTGDRHQEKYQKRKEAQCLERETAQ